MATDAERAAAVMRSALFEVLGKQHVLKHVLGFIRRWAGDPNLKPDRECLRVEKAIEEWHAVLVAATTSDAGKDFVPRAAMRTHLEVILDLCDPMIADKDFSIDTEDGRFDAIARHANAALSNVSTATGSDAGRDFEARVRAEERERCARVAETLKVDLPPRGMRPDEAVEKACADIAAAIRAQK